MIKIRLARMGRKKRPFYSIVAADSRSPRDGKFLEKLGYFDPFSKNQEGFKINKESLDLWISKGAQMTETVENLMKKVQSV